MNAPIPSKPSEVKAWCIENGFHPNRTLGQNFLIDRNTIDAIVGYAGAKQGERILEVGPGMGAITRAMLEAGADVTAVEKDERLAALLKEAVSDFSATFHLHTADMLDVPLDSLLATGTTVPLNASVDHSAYFSSFVSNLPYSVGTRILLEICRHPLAPQRIVVMVQKEVADRLAAPPEGNERGQAGVWVQNNYDVKPLRTVRPTCFWPKPEIASTIVQLVRHERLPLTPRERVCFESITKLAFMHRRKQMAAIFRHGAAGFGLEGDEAIASWLASAGLDTRVRPESITNEQWHTLAKKAAIQDA